MVHDGRNYQFAQKKKLTVLKTPCDLARNTCGHFVQAAPPTTTTAIAIATITAVPTNKWECTSCFDIAKYWYNWYVCLCLQSAEQQISNDHQNHHHFLFISSLWIKYLQHIEPFVLSPYRNVCVCACVCGCFIWVFFCFALSAFSWRFPVSIS